MKRQSALFSHKIHLTPFDDKRIAFRMTKAVYFEIHVKIGPFYGFWTTHLYVQHATDGSVLHPRYAVI